MPDLTDSPAQLTFLRKIEEHGGVTKDFLESLATEHDANLGDLNRSLSIWIKQGLIHIRNGVISVREEGADLVSRTLLEGSAEEEDVSSGATPTKPYEVSKLKVEQRSLSIFQALRKIEKQEINISPEFQRAFVWDIVRQSRLIESILIRIPLPAFYLDATNEIHWNVVDGLQRLTTLHRYCRLAAFELEGLEFLTELNGATFDQLPKKYQVLIEDDTQLIFNNLLPGTPARAKFTIFSRVNTGGLQLTPQEIRHALNQGPITAALAELARNAIFLKSTSYAVDPKRMADKELILRAISFMTFGFDGYKQFGDFDAFLVDSMEKFNAAPKSISGVSEHFLRSVEKVSVIFGPYAFRKLYSINGRRNPFNKALFEAWVVSVKDYDIDVLIDSRDAIITGTINAMNSDEGFLRSITYATGSASAIGKRFESVKAILSEACKELANA